MKTLLQTNRKLRFFSTFLVGSLLVASCKTTTNVELTEISIDKGIPGTIIEVKGKNFNPKYYLNRVTFGNGDTKVISGTTTSLRVVLLKNIASGKVIVNDLESGKADTSAFLFERSGTTTHATPIEDSGSELVIGRDALGNTEYDMNALGVDQPILLVLVQPSDITNPDSSIYYNTSVAANARDYIVQRAAQANTFFTEASYGRTTADFVVTPTWIPMSQTRDFYMWQAEDITRAQNALDGAISDKEALLLNPATTQAEVDAADLEIEEKEDALELANDRQGFVQEPDFYYAEALSQAKTMMPNFDTFGDYVVICAGPSLRGSCCWRENGYSAESTFLNLNFDVQFNATKGSTYMAQGTHWGRLGHELSHFFAGGDLYPSNGSAGTAAPFAFMGSHDSGPLYTAYNLEKRLTYYDPANIANETWGSSPTLNETYDIVAHSSSQSGTADDEVHLLSIQVTEGLYYHVQVRQRPDGTPGNDYIFDQNIPLGPSNPAWQGGVLVTRTIEENNQNNNLERPTQLMPPDRLIQVGEKVNDPARTIEISVEQKISDRPLKYRVRLKWGTLPAADPNGQFDLRITPWGGPPWETIDIWANSLKNDETGPTKIIYKNHEPGDETKPIGNGDAPWVGNDNFLYARVRNEGIVPTPEEVKVSFYVNTPPGVGDDGNWTPFDEVNLGILPAGYDTIVKTNRAWRPSVGEHTCVKVFIHKMTGEIGFNNNEAQENFFEFEAASGSPFQAFEFDVDVRNPYDRAIIMDMKARDVPNLWNAALENGSLFLQPNEVKRMHVVIWTDIDHTALGNPDSQNNRKYNRKPLIGIEGWVDGVGHSYFPVGGVSTLVQAVLKSSIDLKATDEGRTIQGTGIVNPGKSGTSVAIHAVDVAGKHYSSKVITDASGGFKFVIGRKEQLAPGTYQVTAYILEGSEIASSESPTFAITVK